ncbi:hypothetical protein MTQ35_25365 [Escherichia coli]|uniref:RHS element protein dsORF-h1 n=1 Tax=Escherichia coli TaxID=562 RepID=UPI001DDC82C0|nr:hypothetical protein [Escherichia coli]EHO4629684.1 hypothetical protein [Escherichia coli]MCT6044779.1 hypothetical protein [Escherichia coli]MCT6063146.1 hypothetical protein [Escherichia coli]MCT6135268.1 hypothetical protein [Escherichia coli]
MMKYLMVLLSLFSGSVLGMGRVNELCGIDSVKTIEIINLPSYVTTLVPLSKEGLNEIYRYKVVVNEISDLYAGKIIDLLQMKYFRKEKYNNIRWEVSIISKGNNKCEIYFDAFGECGSVNGINVCFEKNEMIGWIKKEIPLLSQKIGGL